MTLNSIHPCDVPGAGPSLRRLLRHPSYSIVVLAVEALRGLASVPSEASAIAEDPACLAALASIAADTDVSRALHALTCLHAAFADVQGLSIRRSQTPAPAKTSKRKAKPKVPTAAPLPPTAANFFALPGLHGALCTALQQSDPEVRVYRLDRKIPAATKSSPSNVNLVGCFYSQENERKYTSIQ